LPPRPGVILGRGRSCSTAAAPAPGDASGRVKTAPAVGRNFSTWCDWSRSVIPEPVPVNNAEALANPEALDLYRDLPELRV
jgi:hypothetical protein